jgi:glycosyltransferase involved in cell wall biosynthesis
MSTNVETSFKSSAMISCLTVSRASRWQMLQCAIADFFAQCHVTAELVIVHDDGEPFTLQIQEQLKTRFIQQLAIRPVSIVAVEPGLTLGELRNAAVDAACGELVCHWDDDDRHHPLRLSLQLDQLVRDHASFCFLRDQLHFYSATSELYWNDWNRDAYPLNFVPGTLLGDRAKMPRYPNERRGEDSAVALSLLRQKVPITRLAHKPWTYVYVTHGSNTFGAEHHAAISRAKAMPAHIMLNHQTEILNRLRQFKEPIAPSLRLVRPGIEPLLVDMSLPMHPPA